MNVTDLDPQGERLPIKIDSTSNGEFLPQALSAASLAGNKLATERAYKYASRTGLSRRQFMMSAMGAASTLLAHNDAHAKSGSQGGWYDLPQIASVDADAATELLAKRELIFDFQGHFVNPTGKWLEKLPPQARPLAGLPKAQCEAAQAGGDRSYLECLSGDEFIKDVFLDSDTDLMVLSFVPSAADAEPLTIEEAAAVRDIVNKMERHRMFLHGRVNPNQPGDLDLMEDLVGRWDICAWKCYTQFGPGGKGFWLDDEPGIALIEKARALDVRNICIHKGLSFGPRSFEHSRCDDIGRVARRYPDVNFLVYHSGYDVIQEEGPFKPGAGVHGIDSLVQSLLDNEVPPNSNVYAELGSSWRMLMQKPTEAAHALGKLFRYVGENNLLWGTDSIWYGSPQDQIQAFRSFQISPEFQDRYEYPAITPAMRSKVFGLNALKPYNLTLAEVEGMIGQDRVQTARAEYSEQPNPSFRTFGPKNRREFLNLRSWGG
ncbi:MAG: amidohydrolase family protein [Pseudomonadota bacterium]